MDLRHAATRMDMHARSRRRRLGGPTSTPPSAPPRRRGRIDPMGRMWPVGDDHATTGGSPPQWRRGPHLPVPPGPHLPCRRDALAGLRLFGSQSLMAAQPRVWCLPLPHQLAAAAPIVSFWRSAAGTSRIAALQACSVGVAAASEGLRVKHKIAVISEQPRNGAGCLARAWPLFHLN